jgi:hypothetical protein
MRLEMTPTERLHYELRQIGCIVCLRHLKIPETPASIHHLFEGFRRDDRLVVALCPGHHQSTGKVLGFHPGGENRFRAAYGFGEHEMLAWSIEELMRRMRS